MQAEYHERPRWTSRGLREPLPATRAVRDTARSFATASLPLQTSSAGVEAPSSREPTVALVRYRISRSSARGDSMKQMALVHPSERPRLGGARPGSGAAPASPPAEGVPAPEPTPAPTLTRYASDRPAGRARPRPRQDRIITLDRRNLGSALGSASGPIEVTSQLQLLHGLGADIKDDGTRVGGAVSRGPRYLPPPPRAGLPPAGPTWAPAAEAQSLAWALQAKVHEEDFKGTVGAALRTRRAYRGAGPSGGLAARPSSGQSSSACP